MNAKPVEFPRSRWSKAKVQLNIHVVDSQVLILIRVMRRDTKLIDIKYENGNIYINLHGKQQLQIN